MLSSFVISENSWLTHFSDCNLFYFSGFGLYPVGTEEGSGKVVGDISEQVSSRSGEKITLFAIDDESALVKKRVNLNYIGTPSKDASYNVKVELIFNQKSVERKDEICDIVRKHIMMSKNAKSVEIETKLVDTFYSTEEEIEELFEEMPHLEDAA
jgi:hypothetical protein